MKFSDQIRKAVDECGLTRYEIGDATGLSQSQISLFQADKRGLSIPALDRLADLLGLNVVMAGKRRKAR